MLYKHALCVYPHLKGAPEKKWFPPVGLEYIATVLEGLVDRLTLIDMRFEPDLERHLANSDVDLVCLSVNWDYQREAALDVIGRIPSQIMLVMGGRYATTHADEFLAADAKVDVIVRGDGEDAIRDIASGLPLKEILGISYRNHGIITHHEVGAFRPLSDTLYPHRALRRVTYKLLFKQLDLGTRIDYILTSRGCPHTCRFCTFASYPLGRRRSWTGRSASSVVEELKTIEAELVIVLDDNFGASMERVGEICDLIIAEGIRKTFLVAVRIEIYRHPHILEKMSIAGFKILTIGIESAQDKTLKAMHKGFDTALAEKAIAEIRKVRFYIHGYFIVGCLGESDTEMVAIASFAKRLRLDTIDLSLLRTGEHSPLNEIVARSEQYHVGRDNIVLPNTVSLDELRKTRAYIYRRYYSVGTVLRIVKDVVAARLISAGYFYRLTFLSIFRSIWSEGRKRGGLCGYLWKDLFRTQD
jgi:anaerobic magnesium-protoporphyrin IX monomethyl ester cyclase